MRLRTRLPGCRAASVRCPNRGSAAVHGRYGKLFISKKLPPLRVGIGDPVGSGRTTPVEKLCKAMRAKWDLVVVTNDIYTKEDQRLLTVAGGEEIPRKGGPGITKSDLLVINKIDLAPYVGADLAVMEADTQRMRPLHASTRPYVMTNLRTNEGLAAVVHSIETRGLLTA